MAMTSIYVREQGMVESKKKLIHSYTYFTNSFSSLIFLPVILNAHCTLVPSIAGKLRHFS